MSWRFTAVSRTDKTVSVTCGENKKEMEQQNWTTTFTNRADKITPDHVRKSSSSIADRVVKPSP